MLSQLRPTLVLLTAFSVLTGLAYPLAMVGVAQALLPEQANGSLVERAGTVIGSRLIGQEFTSDRYFHGRPSATTAPDPDDASKTVDAPYNASNSGGSNLGPSQKSLVEAVTARVEALGVKPAPSDLVTSSASGLDPDITPAAALVQVPRVAASRKLPEAEVRRLVDQQTLGPDLGFLGGRRINVLALNLALDRVTP